MPKGQTRHWLLSTEKTLRHFNILGYRGKSFTWNKDWNRNPTEKSIWFAFVKTFNQVIIPNALIATDAGKTVNYEDVGNALIYVFQRDTESRVRSGVWYKMLSSDQEWETRHVVTPFNLYIKGKMRDGKFVKAKYRYTLAKYLMKSAIWNAVKKFPEIKPSTVDDLVWKLRLDPEAQKMTYAQIMEKFHVGKKSTVSAALKIVSTP